MAQDRPSMQVPAQASGRMLVGLSLSDLRTAALGARPLDGSLSGVCCAEFGLDSLLCQLCHCASVWRVLSGRRVDANHRFLLVSIVCVETDPRIALRVLPPTIAAGTMGGSWTKDQRRRAKWVSAAAAAGRAFSCPWVFPD